ncbi:hypothetical protein O181_031167 [Austropuccinia psidii MF-1]|uniref:Reverse transcriptase domain-containing protein n=1 Tax=Austropuccinia psidii MF-1 TaxID=1389203 RepID=A0A9Q3CX39_9BASI|nr:hypothetical protein [Austropuccinia psidii MF-1]
MNLLRIICNVDIYEYTRIPFSIKNALSQFQSMVDTIFQEEILEGWMVVYIDDIIIYSEELENHVHYIDRVLREETSNFLNGDQFGFSEGDKTEPEGTETHIFGRSSSELHNEFFSSVTKSYGKHKQCIIMLQLLQQKYRSPEMESQLEEPWLRDYKDNKCFLIDGLIYHRQKHTIVLTVIYRDHISLILKQSNDFPYMGHMSEDRIKERVAITA